MAFVYGLQTLLLKHFNRIYQLKDLKPKNKGRTNFYECCDLTKKRISNVHSLMCSTTMCGRISQFFALKKCISPSSWKSWLIALLGMQIMRIEFIQCHHGKKKTQQKKYNFGVYFYEVFFCWRKNILIDIFSPFFGHYLLYYTFSPPF